jgi:hypothetical protein
MELVKREAIQQAIIHRTGLNQSHMPTNTWIVLSNLGKDIAAPTEGHLTDSTPSSSNCSLTGLLSHRSLDGCLMR